MAQDFALQIGTYLKGNCYRIIKIIGQGGFGITYLAEETGYIKSTGFGEEFVPIANPEKVVVKELYFPDICVRDNSTGLVAITGTDKKLQFEKLVNKQLEEGKILKKLSHPNIVKTRDIFKENDTAYMVLDYIDAGNISDLINTAGKLSKTEAINYILQVLQAVGYIHNKKILHLDISPSNILLKKKTNEVILIDFGASLTYADNNHISSTTSNLVTGFKRHYAPNEQGDLDNLKEFDATFDTYAIGATLYHMLTGVLPPISSLVSSGRTKVIPPSVAIQSAEISDYLDNVILKSIAPKFHDRYNSALEMADALTKEANYEKHISLIRKLISNNQAAEAQLEIERAEQLFHATPTLQQLGSTCKDLLESTKNKAELEQTIAKANELYKQGNYNLALPLYQYAQKLSPGQVDISEHINICLEQISKTQGGTNDGDEWRAGRVMKKPHSPQQSTTPQQPVNAPLAETGKTKKSTNKGLIILSIVLAIVLVVVYFYLRKHKPNQLINEEPNTETLSAEQKTEKSIKALLNTADIDFAQKNYTQAVGVYETFPNALSTAEMIGLAHLFQKGDKESNFPSNSYKAIFWYKKAAQKGDKDAYGKVGDMYFDTKNFDSAITYYHHAMDGGDLNAISNLGVIFCSKSFERANIDSAIYWFKKAEEKGVAGAGENAKKLLQIKKLK